MTKVSSVQDSSRVGELFERRVAPLGTCHAMAKRFHRAGKLVVFGNGGPSTDAQHVAVEFVHRVIVGKRALPAVSLTADVATVTGVANRAGLDEIFAHQVRLLGEPADIALGVSADGNCVNVRNGLRQARALGILSTTSCGSWCTCSSSSPASWTRGWCGDGPGPTCHDDVCVTRSDQAVAVTVARLLDDDLAEVATERGTEVVSVALEQARRSTVDKTREITELRAQVLARDGQRLVACADEMAARFAAGGRLLTFGNGGSSTDAQDLAGLFLSPADDSRPLPAICLTNDIAVITAMSNDVGFDVVFARQIAAFGRSTDIAVGLSTSGNSANLLRVRRGWPARPAHRRHRGVRRRQDGRAGQHRPPVRRALAEAKG